VASSGFVPPPSSRGTGDPSTLTSSGPIGPSAHAGTDTFAAKLSRRYRTPEPHEKV